MELSAITRDAGTRQHTGDPTTTRQQTCRQLAVPAVLFILLTRRHSDRAIYGGGAICGGPGVGQELSSVLVPSSEARIENESQRLDVRSASSSVHLPELICLLVHVDAAAAAAQPAWG